MLVLANGAFKSGSTWLREIVRQMRSFDPIPEAFQHPDYPHWIDSRKLAQFLKQGDHRSQSYLSKAHIYDPELAKLLVADADTRILNIHRDIRDVLVSHYYHIRRMNKFSGTFKSYYWRLGRLKACQISEYHCVWSKAAPNVYTTSFEQLKTTFEDEVTQIAAAIGVQLGTADIQRIREETSLTRLRQNSRESEKAEAERFFRKGDVGDWQNHFDQSMLDDLERLQNEGLSVIDSFKYRIMFDYRLRLKRLLLGRPGVASSFLHRW